MNNTRLGKLQILLLASLILSPFIFNTVKYIHAFVNQQQSLTVSQTIKNLITVSVNPSGDAWLNEYYKNRNYGGDTKLVVQTASNNRHIILRFNLTSFASNIVIVSANLSLYYYSKGRKDPAGRTYYCYRLVETDWVEGTKSGRRETGSCCWNYRQYDTLYWTMPGGTYTTTDGASAEVPSSFGWMTWNVTSQVQYAINNTGKIVNLIIMDGNEYSSKKYKAKFYSREYTNQAFIPKLEVKYKLE